MIPGFEKSRSAKAACLSYEREVSQRGSADPDFDQLRELTAVGRALTYTTTLEQVTRLTVERGADLLGASAAVLMLPDPQGLLQVRAAHGVTNDQLVRFSAPLGDELIERLQGLLGVNASQFIAVPLIVGGQVTGVLAVALRAEFSLSDEWLLSALADQAAVALENARLNGEVRVDMEDRLRASEGATNDKDRALSTLAHDIRTPLGAIEGYCAILIDEIQGSVNDRQRDTIERIRLSGRHLLGLLDNVMDMARINAGVVQVDLAPVQLADVAREAYQMLIPAADARFQTLRVHELDRVMILADQARLRQVLVNLIGNAVKFTPTDGRIDVSVQSCCLEGTAWGELKVSDTGPGIAEAELDSVFAPYYRTAGAARVPGVGLGLAISHALVHQMGGALTVESPPGAGACFTVRLPAFSRDGRGRGGSQ
jgi:phosphoserine phosphatase RsbU/P